MTAAPSPSVFHASPLFRGLRVEDCEILIEMATLRAFSEDETILTLGQTNASLFVILEGEVLVERTEETNIPVITLETGDVFGEMSFIDDATVTADVRAYNECKVLEMSGARLSQLFQARTDLAAQVYRNLAIELRNRLSRTAQLMRHYAELNELLSEDPDSGSLFGYT